MNISPTENLNRRPCNEVSTEADFMFNRILPRIHRFPCPDEHQLAAYVDQQLIGSERQRVETHLVKCDPCLQQVGFLIKQSGGATGPVPTSLMHRAKALRTAADSKVFLDWKLASVAAVIAITIALLVWRKMGPIREEHPIVAATAQRPPAPVIRDNSTSDADTAVRSVLPADSQPIVLSPQPDEIVQASDFTIRWKPVANSAAYEVRIVTAEGDLVWRKRVHENSANPPKDAVRPGSKYFVWVRAWLENGKTQQSQAIGFIGG